MAAITTAGSGNWTSTTPNAPWPGGTVPTSADDVTIAKNHTVTLDATTCVANTITIANGTTGSDVGGILTCTTSANWKLTLQNGLSGTATSNPSNTATYAGSVNFDMSASSYTGEVVLNNANSTTDGTGIFKLYGNYQLKGKPRKRHTTINSALTANSTKSVVVADATGWAAGDRLVFATTSAYNATPRTDVVTIATITPGTGTTATITWTDGAGTGGAVLYDHASGCPVGNFTSNLIFRPATAYYRSAVSLNGDTNQLSVDSYIDNVLFSEMRVSGYSQNVLNTQTARSTRHKAITNCAFYQWDSGNAMFFQYIAGSMARNWNVFYSVRSGSGGPFNTVDNSFLYNYGPDEDYAVFAAGGSMAVAGPGQTQRRHKISGVFMSESTAAGAMRINVAALVEDCDFWSNSTASIHAVAPVEVNRCRFNSVVFTNGTSAVNVYGDVACYGTGEMIMKDCQVPSGFKAGQISTSLPSYVQLVNRNGDSGVQEFYQYQSTTVPAIQRTTTSGEYTNSTSGIEITLNSSVAQTYSATILAKAGAALKILMKVKKGATYKSGSYTEPSATLSGLGITPVTATATAASDGAWELLTIDLGSGSAPTSDGELTLTISAQSATASAQCWFSGVPFSPFITRCRHYGYVFDETIPTRTANPYTVASEATAGAYTGVTLNNSTKLITFGAGTADTAQKFYDYVQAWCVADVSREVPLSRAGTTYLLDTAWTVQDPVYSGELVWSGTVYYSSTGTKSDSLGDCVIELDAVGTFTFDGSISGTLDLRNMGASGITVELPTGTSYTTANNTGGTITVSTPQLYQSVTVTGLTTGSRVQIYDTTNSLELSNAVTAGTTATWTDSVAAVASRAIRVRISYVSGASAKGFIEANIGTCGTTSSDAAVAYLANQTNDTVYINNAIDGSTVTGVTFTDSGTDVINISVAAATITWKSIYAAWVAYAFTSTGIASDIDYIEAVDEANYLLSNLIVKNTSSPTVPLEITGGYARDATSGAAIDLIDTTGGTIVIAPDHVVSYAVGSGVTSQDKVDIAAEVLSQASASPIHSDIKKITGLTITGAGTEASPWGP